jgi:peptide/nickel transport system substrate-binding protein
MLLHRAARDGWIKNMGFVVVGISMQTVSSSCRDGGAQATKARSSIVLRVGVAQLSASNPMFGIRQLRQNLSVESLARIGEDGHMQPWLAESWHSDGSGRTLTVKLRPNVKFHDGSPLDAQTVATVLASGLRSQMGPVYSDIEHVTALARDSLEVAFKQASPFLVESLEVPIQKPGPAPVGTGPFAMHESASELRANANYYLGRPLIDRITVSNHASVRAAWAEMLRDNLDMLYEVGSDALDSLEGSSQIATFTYTRHYQYVIALNPSAPPLHARDTRRALNLAIDRTKVIKEALNGHGIASSSPLSPKHWALPQNGPRFEFDPRQAAALLAADGSRANLRFTCLASPDSLDERIALAVKRQLAGVGVDMNIQEASRDEIVDRAGRGDYEAIMTEAIAGPNLLRPYSNWQTHGAANWGQFGNATVDTALDRLRYSKSPSEYQAAIVETLRAFVDDPPAIFLAWSVRARALNKRFEIPPLEPGRDILSNIRLWKPTDEREAGQN